MASITALQHQAHCRSLDTLDNEDCNCEPTCVAPHVGPRTKEITDGGWLRMVCTNPGCHWASIRYRRGA